MTIRRGTAADAAALARLRYEFRAALGTPTESEEAFVERCTRWMAARLGGSAAWMCWLAVADGEPAVAGGNDSVAGTVWVELFEKMPNPVAELEAHAYLTNLYVRPALRGAGVGSLLLGAALAECASRSVDQVILSPTPRSRPLYERHGFAVRGDLMTTAKRAGAVKR